MLLITQREKIRTASQRWDAAYKYQPTEDKVLIGNQLRALNPETATADEVNEIIGNKSWTVCICNECGDRESLTVIQVGQEPDYESSTANLCLPCATKAFNMIKDYKP